MFSRSIRPDCQQIGSEIDSLSTPSVRHRRLPATQDRIVRCRGGRGRHPRARRSAFRNSTRSSKIVGRSKSRSRSPKQNSAMPNTSRGECGKNVGRRIVSRLTPPATRSELDGVCQGVDFSLEACRFGLLRGSSGRTFDLFRNPMLYPAELQARAPRSGPWGTVARPARPDGGGAGRRTYYAPGS